MCSSRTIVMHMCSSTCHQMMCRGPQIGAQSFLLLSPSHVLSPHSVVISVGPRMLSQRHCWASPPHTLIHPSPPQGRGCRHSGTAGPPPHTLIYPPTPAGPRMPSQRHCRPPLALLWRSRRLPVAASGSGPAAPWTCSPTTSRCGDGEEAGGKGNSWGQEAGREQEQGGWGIGTG